MGGHGREYELQMDSVDPTPHLERFENYEQACREFRWLIPLRLNIATAICRRHRDAVTRIGLNEVKDGGINTYTFGGLDFLSDKFATALSDSDITSGDRIAIMLPPSAALAVAQLGALKTGAVVIPLSNVSNVGFVEHALGQSGAKAVVVAESSYHTVERAARHLPAMESRFVVRDSDISSIDYTDFWGAINKASSDFKAVETPASSPAFIFYIESQGNLLGVIHSHRSIIGQLAAFEMFNNVESDSVFWTSADWSTPVDILGVLYPAWWYGCSLAGTPEEPTSVTRLLEQCEITHVFLPARHLKELDEPERQPGGPSKERTIVVEAQSSQRDPQNRKPGLILNEVHGKPETGWIFGKCERWFATPAGSVGRRVPGRSIEIIDETGTVIPARHHGYIAVHKSDPALFTGYYQSDDRTAAAFLGDWFLTGDLGYKSDDGELYVTHTPDEPGADQASRIDNGC